MPINWNTPLGGLLARCRRGVGVAAGLSSIVNLLLLVVAIYSMQVFDRVLSSGSLETLGMLTLIAAAAIAAGCWLDALKGQVTGRVALWLDAAVSERLTGSMVDRALRGDAYRSEGLRDAATLRGFLAGPALAAFFDLPWVPVYVGIIFLMHPALGWIVLAGAVMLFGLALLNDRLTRAALTEAAGAATSALRRVEAALGSVEAIDAMGLTRPLAARWTNSFAAAAALQMQAGERAGRLLAVTKALRLLVQVLVTAAGAWAVLAFEATPGMLVASSLVLARAFGPVEQIVAAWGQTQAAAEAYRRLDAALAQAPRRERSLPLPAPAGQLDVEGLTYAPAGAAALVLDAVSFSAEPGEVIGILGPSAAGKSTLARLLVGVARPLAGHVRLDGGDLFARDRSEIGPYVGYLPQDVQLLPGTIAENIARFAEDAVPERIVEAAHAAGIHAMILRLPAGYETVLAAGGTPLSGGQRQLLGLARALYGMPRLVVLDEPNASLDPEGEAMLARTVASLKQAGRTVLVIGHRPAIFAQVDKLLVLKGGRVAAFGPRTEIVAQLNPARATAA